MAPFFACFIVSQNVDFGTRILKSLASIKILKEKDNRWKWQMI